MASLEVVDADGDTALAAAVRFRRKETVTLLLDRAPASATCAPTATHAGPGPDPGSDAEVPRYPVDPALVQRMLEAGVDANQPSGGDGRLPLHLALVSEQRDHALPLLEMLLAHGADIQRPGARPGRQRPAALQCAVHRALRLPLPARRYAATCPSSDGC